MGHYHHNKEKNLFLSILLNTVITVAQIISGILSGSLALISDALHNFSDVISLLFSYIALKLSKRKASYNQTFGYKRAQLIAAFVNALSLLIVAFYLIYEAVLRFLNPQVIQPNLVIWLAGLGILVNGLSVLLLKNDHQDNLNIKSAYLHLLTDMLASVAVLIGGVLMYYFKIYWIDSVLTFAIAIYLLYVGYDLLISATKMLMLFTPDHINIEQIVSLVNKTEGVKRLHHVHVWYLNEDELHLEAHLECIDNISISQFNSILNNVEHLLLQKFKINHVTIQPEFQKEDSKEIIVQD